MWKAGCFCGLVGNLCVESELFLWSCGKHINCDAADCFCDSVGNFNVEKQVATVIL